MTFMIDEPAFRSVINSVDAETETADTNARAVDTALSDLHAACKDANLSSAVSTLQDDVIGRALSALSASSESVITAGHATATEYEDFDAEAAAKASTAKLEGQAR
ncbi:MAG: hypothetical protein Q4C81_09970 [Kocuria sp.]|nr:hypothetical protein [Kocuria sp.]